MTTKSTKGVFERNPDAPMGYMIKRPDTIHCEHKSKLLKRGANFIMIVGSTGEGKSTALLSWLPCFTNQTKYIILASSKGEDDVFTCIEHYCQHEKIDFRIVNDAEHCANAISQVLSEKTPDEHMIVIFDDFNTNYSGKAEDPLNHIMIQTFSTLRSSGCSAFAITQAYCNIPVKCRENCNIRQVFSLGSAISVQKFFEELSGAFYHGGSETALKQDLKGIYEKVREQPYQFMLVLTHPPRQIRIGWNQIEYPPDQEGSIVAGKVVEKRDEVSPLHEMRSQSTSRRVALWKQARALGLEGYHYKDTDIAMLEKFIQRMSSQAEAKAGNTAPELKVGGALEEIRSMREQKAQSIPYRKRQFTTRMKQYKKSKDPRFIESMVQIANQLSEMDVSTIDWVRYLIRKNGLTDVVDIG